MKFPVKQLCAAALALALSSAYAQPVKPIGQVATVEMTHNGVRLRTDNAHVEVSVYSPNVIRVRIDKQPLAPSFSYAVVAKPQTGKANITQNDREIVIDTGKLIARIGKKPFSVTFTTPDGQVISQDEPGLTTSWIGEEVTTYKTMQEGERFIGLGEKGGDLDRRGHAYTNWNTDVGQYTSYSDPLYATVPFYIGTHHGLAYGVFFDNTYRSDFNFGASNNRFASFSAQGGEMDYYFIHHPKVADIIGSYTALTGRMPMPPLWSLGYQQNRYTYYPEAEVMRIAQTLREKKIPADGITLDIHYMDAYKLFTWDKQRFPDPAGMTARLKAIGFNTTLIVDPGIKIEKGYGAYERGVKDDIFVKYADGSYYSGEVWPGWVHFPDFTSAKGRDWWHKEIRTYAEQGVAGIWNDMNEIATWGQSMPNNLLFKYDGTPTTHKQAHNVYGMQMARASYEGMKAATGKRPFMLTRAGYAGLQRYTAIWTGDNTADEGHMLLGVRLLNSLGASGIAFTGMDVGGFAGAPTPSLYERWMQIGAFTPYFRNHAAVNSKSSEPWTFGTEVMDNARDYINLRYRLLPYLYSAFNDAATSGEPIMRTLAIDYTNEAQVFAPAFQNQYLFGKALLVAPFESTKEFGKVYLPSGTWYDLYTDALQIGGQERVLELSVARLPVFVKGGSVIPLQSLIQSTAERPTDTLALHVFKGDADNVSTYYEDDGISFGYEKGAYYKRAISYDAAARKITFGAVEGKLKSKFSKLEIVLHGFGEAPTLSRDGAALRVSARENAFVPSVAKPVKLSSVVIDNNSGAFSLGY
jgi:alpha-glucosidase